LKEPFEIDGARVEVGGSIASRSSRGRHDYDA